MTQALGIDSQKDFRLVGNYGFFEGQDQRLKSELGLVIDSQLIAVYRQKNQTCLKFHRSSRTLDPDHDSAHQENCLVSLCLVVVTFHHVPYYKCLVWKHLVTDHGQVSRYHSTTCHRWIAIVLKRKPVCCKLIRPDLVTTHQVFGYRVSYFRSSQEDSRKSCRKKQTRQLQQ